MKGHPRKNIFISAAEPSADKFASRLIKKIYDKYTHYRCTGLGGDKMEQAGCDIMENLVDRAAMLSHALSQVGFYHQLLKRVKKEFEFEIPDLVIVVDSPAWNFHVAKAAQAFGIPVLFYVAPQLWAWGQWRVKKLKALADHVACLLPFEEQWFNERGIPATYVGHPLFDDEELIRYKVESEQARVFPTIALLPGSRRHEIKYLWKPMQQIAEKIEQQFGRIKLLTAALNDEAKEQLEAELVTDLPIDIRAASVEAVTRYADLALVASGSATLEVAAQQCPMMVMYHVPMWQWKLGRRMLLKTPYISLINILADREVVPEFIPFNKRVDEIAETAIAWLNNDSHLRDKQLELHQLMQPIIRPGASDNVLQLIEQLLPDY